MNIVTPLPTAIPFTTSNVNTESARRDNLQRETIPQLNGTENSAAESGLGSESDRVKKAAQSSSQPLTYERPQPQNSDGSLEQQQATDRDNGEDPSAGRENAESRQQEQQERAEQQEIQELKARDREVRAHEQAHAAVGGQYAGSPSYDFETGPDGQQYAVGGEVSIDISKEETPEETVRKMQQVRAAALAPNEPSPQDLRVAGEATQRASEARTEIARENSEQAQENFDQNFQSVFGDQEVSAAERGSEGPDLDDIVDNGDIGGSRRSLQEDDPVAEAAGLETSSDDFRRETASRDVEINQRALRIANFYQQVSEPRTFAIQQSA